MKFMEKIVSVLGRHGRTKWKKRNKNKSPQKKRGRRWKGKKRDRVTKDMIEYLLNDYSTPNMVKVVAPPPKPELKITVKDYKGGGYQLNSLQGRAANAYVTVANGLSYFAKQTNVKMKRWSVTSNLKIIPVAGQKLNAFYNRISMQFFYARDPVSKKLVYTVDSSEIVAHELGHAILDSYRPDTYFAASLEIWSFHEAFADVTAMLSIMQHDEVLERALERTGGNIRKRNIFSNLAEDVGRTIYNHTGGRGGRNPNYLRSAINNFKYVNPGTLPESAPHNQLAAESHSFGRIFLGAFYDILVMVYEDGVNGGKTQIEALRIARDVLANRTLTAIQNAPLNVKFYESVAKTMLWAELRQSGIYHDRIRSIFLNRNLMRSELRMLNAPKCNDDKGIVKIHNCLNVKLCNHLIRAQSNNPLYDVELEIPQEEIYLYDNNRSIVDSVIVTESESLSAAQDMIHYLHRSGSVGAGSDTPFEVADGKLVRTHFS